MKDIFELINVEEKDKNIIYNLMQLYTYELSYFEDETATFTMLDSGLYVMNKYVEKYWQEENRRPYILKCNKRKNTLIKRHKITYKKN